MPCLPAAFLACLIGIHVAPQALDSTQNSEQQQDSVPQEMAGMPLVFSADFQADKLGTIPAEFAVTDDSAWKVEEADAEHGHVLSQFKKSDYEPPHRSPLSIALIKDLAVGDFVLTARVKSTIPDYGHRDACVFFGHQDASHFYYVHFGKQTDDAANQIFIVNDAPRTKISTKTTSGTPWDDAWHQIKIVRNTESGTIQVFFDDMDEPVMSATNKEFAEGQLGFGSFDDTTQWDDVRVYAGEMKPDKEKAAPGSGNHSSDVSGNGTNWPFVGSDPDGI